MRLKGREIEQFVKRPDPAYALVLIYGPDEGLVRERSQAIAQSYLAKSDDPFARVDLSEDEFKADPARLSDEFGAISMFGGHRVICVRLGSDRYGKHFKEIVQALDAGEMTGAATILVEAGDLKVSSVLRKTVEGSARAIALPCYRDDARSLRDLVIATLKDHNIHFTDETLTTLIQHLGSDRAVTRQELHKLVLYKSTDTIHSNTLMDADIDAAIASANLIGLQDVAYATASGDLAHLTSSLERCFLQNEQPISILRSVARHLEQIYNALCAIEQGTAAKTAVDKLQPRIHFQRRRAFDQHLRQWTKKRCERALTLIYDTEKDCKTTGMPAESLCAQTLIRLARAARSVRRAA